MVFGGRKYNLTQAPLHVGCLLGTVNVKFHQNTGRWDGTGKDQGIFPHIPKELSLQFDLFPATVTKAPVFMGLS